MTQEKAYGVIIREYLSKLKDIGCDGCIAETYCILHRLRKDRYPQDDCEEKVRAYLRLIH